MEKKIEKTDSKTTIPEIIVVKELPQQQINEVVTEDGKVIPVLTTEEAIKEILLSIRKIAKNFE